MYERSGTLVSRKFREYLIPTVLVNVALSLEMVINSAVVGNLLGELSLSAIGLASPIINTINAVMLLFVVGGVICASIAKGQRDGEKANRIFTLAFASGLGFMVLLLIVLLIFMKPLTLFLAQGNDELAALATAYLTPMAFVCPVMILIAGVAQFTRADGWPRLAAFLALSANVLSLTLCYTLIRFFGMGIAGASVSTLIGYSAASLLILPYLFSKNRTFRFVKLPRGTIKMLAQIVSVSLPEALTEILSFFRNIILNILIVSVLGAQGMAVMAVCISIKVLTYTFINGTTDTMLPIVGTLFGEKDHKGIRFTVGTAFKFTLGVCVAFMALLLIFPAAVVGLFGLSSAEGLAESIPAIRMFALSLFFLSINTLLQSYYQTTGRQTLASFGVVLNGLVFVVLFAFGLSRWNADFIWLAFFFSELAALLALLAAGLWIRRKEGANGLLLLSADDESETSLDISISASIEEATGLSRHVMDFCRENGVGGPGAMRMGIAAEEMAVNTVQYGHKNAKGVIDALVRITEQELILRLRDDGIPFDPTQYNPGEENAFAVGGIEVVRRLAKDVSYDRQLGFNVSIITILRETLKNDSE